MATVQICRASLIAGFLCRALTTLLKANAAHAEGPPGGSAVVVRA